MLERYAMCGRMGGGDVIAANGVVLIVVVVLMECGTSSRGNVSPSEC